MMTDKERKKIGVVLSDDLHCVPGTTEEMLNKFDALGVRLQSKMGKEVIKLLLKYTKVVFDQSNNAVMAVDPAIFKIIQDKYDFVYID